MRTRILTLSLVILLIGISCQRRCKPSRPTRDRRSLGLPPLPAGVGPVENFATLHGPPQGQFLEGARSIRQGNLWFVGIGSGWISYLQPDGKLVPVVLSTATAGEIGQTCEPQGTRFKHEST